MRPSTATNAKLPLRWTAKLASKSGRPMNRTSAKTPATATEPVISRLPICTSLAPAFMLADQISDFMPRCSCSPINARPRMKGSFQSRYAPAHLDAGLSSPLPEPLDLSAGVHDALRAREERMADGADLGLQLLARGSGRERVPARAGDDRVFVKGGVNLCLHGFLRGG